MTKPVNRAWKTTWTAVRLMLIFTVLLGIAYPVVIWELGQAAFHDQANGSLVHTSDGRVTGSSLIGQSFTDASGNPLRQYFQSRPSAAGSGPGYDAKASGGSNLGPDSRKLVAEIAQRRRQVAAFDGVPESDIPPDAVTASGSGLDPDISPAYAAIQVKRVADARGLPVATVEALVAAHTTGRDLGYLGEPRVDVVELNLALDALK